MKAQDFIIKSVKRIVTDFPFVQCTYQFDEFCGLHSVQVLPKDYLNTPQGFGNVQYEITKDFLTLFPHERLSFFSSDNSMEVEPEDVIITVQGKLFKHISNKELGLFPEDMVSISNGNSIIAGDGNYALAA